MFYERHVFFCVNQRTNGSQCCQDHDASDFRDYMKSQLKQKGLLGEGMLRVNNAGCLGRCELGPVIVIYPEGTWYTYQTTADIDEIIASHLLANTPVQRLLI